MLKKTWYFGRSKLLREIEKGKVKRYDQFKIKRDIKIDEASIQSDIKRYASKLRRKHRNGLG